MAAMATNVKKHAAEERTARAAVEQCGVGDLKGAAEVLALAETAPDVKGARPTSG